MMDRYKKRPKTLNSFYCYHDPQRGNQRNITTLLHRSYLKQYLYLSRTVTRLVEVHIFSFLAVHSNRLLSRITILVIDKLQFRHVVKQLGEMTTDLSNRTASIGLKI